MAIKLKPVVAEHARNLARIIRVIHRKSKSQAEIQAKFQVYFQRVADELIALGEPPDLAAEMALAAIGILLDEINSRIVRKKRRKIRARAYSEGSSVLIRVRNCFKDPVGFLTFPIGW
ncbi:MAG: hypothetical protein ABSG74_14385 [Candidatus Bathyarchaeia archaeon]